ncbi:MAG: hypothetical protein ABIN20_00175 [candidate division WOR-3 bacterium]
MKNLKKFLRKLFLRIFKLKPEKKFISLPLSLKNFDKVIVIHDGEDKEIEKILMEMNFKDYFVIKLDKKNEDLFLEKITKKTLVIDLCKVSQNIFLKYLSKDFPVIGLRRDLTISLPGRDYHNFFENFLKIQGL